MRVGTKDACYITQWHIFYVPPLHNKAAWDFESMRGYSIDGNNILRVKSSCTNISTCSPNLEHIRSEERILYSICKKHFPSHLRFSSFVIFKLMLTRTETPIFQDFFSLINVSLSVKIINITHLSQGNIT